MVRVDIDNDNEYALPTLTSTDLRVSVGHERRRGRGQSDARGLAQVHHQSPKLFQGVALHHDVVLGQQECGNLGQLSNTR